MTHSFPTRRSSDLITTARFIAVLVKRNSATASGSAISAFFASTPSVFDASSIAGRQASELCVLSATASVWDHRADEARRGDAHDQPGEQQAEQDTGDPDGRDDQHIVKQPAERREPDRQS